MSRLWQGSLAVVATAAALAALIPPCPAAEDTALPSIKIGLVNSLFRDTPESLFQLMMRPLKQLMETQTGFTGTLSAGGDPCRLAGQLQDDKFQLAVFHGVEFAWVRQKYPNLKPLVIAVRDGRPMYAHLVVASDSKAAGVGDLRGQTLAMSRECREHCRMFLDKRCPTCGQCSTALFCKITTPCDSEDSLDDVVDGVVQAAVVDGCSLEKYKKAKPDRFVKLKSILSSEPFPPAVVAYKPGVLSDDALHRFRDGMITANQNPKGKQLLNMCRLTCFEQVPADYEQMLLDIAKAYPPPTKVVAGK